MRYYMMTAGQRAPICDVRERGKELVVHWLSHPAHSLLQVDNPRSIVIDGLGKKQVPAGFKAYMASIPDHEYSEIPGREVVP